MRSLVGLAALAACLSANAAGLAPGRVLFLEDGAQDARWRDRFEEALSPRRLVVAYSIDAGPAFAGMLKDFSPSVVVARRAPPAAVAAALEAAGKTALVAADPVEAARRVDGTAPPESYARLAEEQLRFGDDRGARANAARALAAAPKDPAALKIMAEVAKDQHDPWLAIRSAGDREAAQARFTVGDYAGAEEAFKRAVAADPADAASWRGLAASTRQRPKEALAAADKAGARLLAGEIRCDLGDAAGCETDVRGALQQSGDDLETLWAYVRLKRDPAYAQRAFAAAGRVPLWARGSAYRLSARIWLELKDESHAAESLRRAIKLNPDDIEALDALGDLKDRSPAPAVAAAMPGWSTPDPLETLRRGVDRAKAAKNHLEAVALARRFAAAIRTAPAWEQADAYREATRMWLELGYPWKACLTVREAENLDQRSVETQELISKLRAHLPGLEVDGPRSQQIAEIDRDIAKLRSETARLRAILLP